MNSTPVYVDSHNIISPLGNTSEINFQNAIEGTSGIKQHDDSAINEESFYAALISNDQISEISPKANSKNNYTLFEKLMIASVEEALSHSSVDVTSEETLFVVSTTKGNISLLESHHELDEIKAQLSLMHSAKMLTTYFKNPAHPANSANPVVISNACISGVAALLFARRQLQAGLYKYAIVVGADTISKFVFSGFKSFQALSKSICRPFSADRDGINLGEAASTIILSVNKPKHDNVIEILQGAISNDSNHISGPSRTGQELSAAINIALTESDVLPEQVGFISAHGTGTVFNDEMESKAFALSGLQSTPVNSLKPYFGHTLGAAGILESVMSTLSLEKNIILPTPGFKRSQASAQVNASDHAISRNIRYCLKSASGFGGCNGAVVFGKNLHQ